MADFRVDARPVSWQFDVLEPSVTGGSPPKPPWWRDWPRLIGEAYRLLRRLEMIGEQTGIADWIQNLLSRRRVREV